jgi:hypothetical protein
MKQILRANLLFNDLVPIVRAMLGAMLKSRNRRRWIQTPYITTG